MLTIETVYPSLQVQTYQPEIRIKQEFIQMEIEKSHPSLQIEQKQSLRELGLGDCAGLRQKIKEVSYQKILAGIAEYARDGDAVLNRAGGLREEMIFTDLLKEKRETELCELNVQASPRTRPKIEFRHEQKISWRGGGVKIAFQLRPPELTWKLGRVTVDIQG